jgi:hypothetical protein
LVCICLAEKFGKVNHRCSPTYSLSYPAGWNTTGRLMDAEMGRVEGVSSAAGHFVNACGEGHRNVRCE